MATSLAQFEQTGHSKGRPKLACKRKASTEKPRSALLNGRVYFLQIFRPLLARLALTCAPKVSESWKQFWPTRAGWKVLSELRLGRTEQAPARS